MTGIRPIRRRAGSRGAGLLEFALIFPLLATLVFGLIEAGFALRDDNILDRAVSQAARVGSGEADSRLADYELLASLDSALASVNASSLQKVIVWDATSSDDPPAACRSQARPDDTTVVGIANRCNVYSPTQVRADSPASFGIADGDCAGDWDTNWCPLNRTRTGDNPDRIGVYVELRFDKVTSYLPGSLTLTESAIYQLEPCVAGDPTC